MEEGVAGDRGVGKGVAVGPGASVYAGDVGAGAAAAQAVSNRATAAASSHPGAPMPCRIKKRIIVSNTITNSALPQEPGPGLAPPLWLETMFNLP